MVNEGASMSAKVLIVEDEILVAVHMEAILEDLGHVCAGIAPDTEAALALADAAPDVALVDVNLRDGPTGPRIGELLTARGVTVLFVTANPRMLCDGVPGALGVVGKPCDDAILGTVIDFALRRRRGEPVDPPAAIQAFA